MRDFSDDLIALMDALEFPRAIFVAHSAGAGTVMQLTIDHPERVAGMVLEAPMSPYGFGGTRDAPEPRAGPTSPAPAAARPARTSRSASRGGIAPRRARSRRAT